LKRTLPSAVSFSSTSFWQQEVVSHQAFLVHIVLPRNKTSFSITMAKDQLLVNFRFEHRAIQAKFQTSVDYNFFIARGIVSQSGTKLSEFTLCFLEIRRQSPSPWQKISFWSTSGFSITLY
jgi:hypothetical protein